MYDVEELDWQRAARHRFVWIMVGPSETRLITSKQLMMASSHDKPASL